MAAAGKETYRGSLTRGTLSPRDSGADMVIHVTGLDGDRDNLDVAINTAIVGRLVHPDDNTLPLRRARAVWHRGADSGENAEAFVFLFYDKRGSGTASTGLQFQNIANVRVSHDTIPWWGKTLQEPGDEDAEGEPNLMSDPGAGNAAIELPQQHYVQVVIWDITIPVVLSSSPITAVDDMVGTINANNFTIGGKSFDKHQLRFDGLTQNVTRIYDGSATTYEFLVQYAFKRRRDGWYYSYLKSAAGDPKTYKASKRRMYKPVDFTEPPTS